MSWLLARFLAPHEGPELARSDSLI